jgi:hypothetical protein
MLVLIDFAISQTLAMSEKQREKRVAKSTQVVKIAELEVVARSQADRIVELKPTCTNFKCEKDKVTYAYRRLPEKHKSLAEKAKHDKTKLAEAHTTELTKHHAYLDLETRSYTEYRQNVRRQLHELHKAVALSFEEVKVQCLPFPDKGAKVEEVIDWIVREVKVVPDTIWRLNDNFAILGTKGVLSMLNGEGCQELGPLHDLASSRDTAVLEDVPEDVHKLKG